MANEYHTQAMESKQRKVAEIVASALWPTMLIVLASRLTTQSLATGASLFAAAHGQSFQGRRLMRMSLK